MNLPRSFIIAALLMLSVSACTGAQRLHAQAANSASFIGTVLDSSGAPVEGADVSVTNTETGETASAVTDDQGRYYIENIGNGVYDHLVEKEGFEKSLHTGIAVDRPNRFVVNVILQPSGAPSK